MPLPRTIRLAPIRGGRKRTTRKRTVMKRKGGFAPALIPIAGALGTALATPLLTRAGSKLADWLGLGKRKRTTRKRKSTRGRGLVRAGARRTTGGTMASILRMLRRR